MGEVGQVLLWLRPVYMEYCSNWINATPKHVVSYKTWVDIIQVFNGVYRYKSENQSKADNEIIRLHRSECQYSIEHMHGIAYL